MGTIGTVTPASAATSVVYMPQAATTVSAVTSPRSVTTRRMRPPSTIRSVTRVPASTSTPFAFAAPSRA